MVRSIIPINQQDYAIPSYQIQIILYYNTYSHLILQGQWSVSTANYQSVSAIFAKLSEQYREIITIYQPVSVNFHLI